VNEYTVSAEKNKMSLILKNILKSKLKDSGVGVSSLAKKTGISRKTIENWLEGQKPQNIEQVKIVADFFKMSVDEICFGPTLKPMDSTSPLDQHRDEINAGVFEVVLRRVKS
jgi:lambda repressor-like predicted transcriptional regulator